MFEVEIDSWQFEGFQGVNSNFPSQSCFTVLMHVLPREGEIIFLDQLLVPEKNLTGIYAPKVNQDGQYSGYFEFEVLTVSHRVKDGKHVPHLFCKQSLPAFSSE